MDGAVPKHEGMDRFKGKTVNGETTTHVYDGQELMVDIGKSVYEADVYVRGTDGAIGIIGGADGPTAIFVSGKQQGDTRTACSSLHFAPVEPENIRWKVTYYQKQFPDETIALL